MRGFALIKLGRLDEAERELRRSEAEATKTHTPGEVWRQIRFALAVAQRDTATSETLARQILASALDAKADANLVSNAAGLAAPALAHIGRTDDAIRILEKSIEVGAPPAYDWLLVEPDFRSLRGEPPLREGPRCLSGRRSNGREDPRAGSRPRRDAEVL